METRRPKVLVVVRDDSVALSVFRSLYLGGEDFDVIAARTPEIAQSLLEELPIAAVIVDSTVAEEQDAALLRWIAQRSSDTFIVLLSEGPADAVLACTSPMGLLHRIPLPAVPEHVCQMVRECIEARGSLAGSLAALSVPDLIQMLCLGVRSSTIVLKSKNRYGVILVSKGNVIHAAWGEETGESALAKLLALQEGSFRLAPLPHEPQETIHRGWQHVLLDCLRSIDEGNRSGGVRRSAFPRPVEELSWSWSPPPLSEEPTHFVSEIRPLVEAPPQESAALLVDRGFVALRAGRWREAQECWTEALRQDPLNRTLELNLRMLQTKYARAS